MPKLEAPASGARVRMYRPGHGDCFLLAIPRIGGGEPVYVLIDCGLKPHSEEYIHKKPVTEIVKHIGESTGNRIDLAIITHEHEDHVNGFIKESFDPFHIEKAWLAWTEDPLDDDANQLRKDHGDTLLTLIEARRKLAQEGQGVVSAVARIDELIGFETSDPETFAAADPTKDREKVAMKVIKDKAAANSGVCYYGPEDKPVDIPETQVRVYVLGPPRDTEKLKSADPRKGEGFPDGRHGFGFGDAAMADGTISELFDPKFGKSIARSQDDAFFAEHYGRKNQGKLNAKSKSTLDNADFRRIDSEWLFTAETLAIDLNTWVNNTSLVLALEFKATKKVLLFIGDAQRGNWVSWLDQNWTADGATVTVQDLLKRTVLYKVGHHGSHNATLFGTTDSKHPNLSWIGTDFAGEFTAMITAVTTWAETKKWVHPLPSIRRALARKTQGRLFQTDMTRLRKGSTISDTAWKAFLDRTDRQELYFDFTILDE